MLITSNEFETAYEVLSPDQLAAGMRCFRALGFMIAGPDKDSVRSWSLVPAVVLSMTRTADGFYDVKYEHADLRRSDSGLVMSVLLPHPNLKLVRLAVAVGCRRVSLLEVEE